MIIKLVTIGLARLVWVSTIKTVTKIKQVVYIIPCDIVFDRTSLDGPRSSLTSRPKKSMVL